VTGEKLQYTSLRGEVIEEELSVTTDPVAHPAHHSLQFRKVRFGTDQFTSRTMILAADQVGYDLVDNEILAGLQLYRLTGPDLYPLEVSRLIGYCADGPESFVLLEPYRGVPIADVAGKLLTADRRRFQISLLTAIRWLSMAGVAHRNIGPRTVRWDEESCTVQITDFAHATLFGTPRQIVGTPPWAAPEQRANRTIGEVGERDDIWAAGRLIFYVVTGEEPTDRDSISEEPDLAQLLDGVFGPPEERPTVRDLLTSRLGIKDLVAAQRQEDPVLAQGRAEFWTHYESKNAGTLDPAASGKHALAADAPKGRNRALVITAVVIVGVVLTVMILILAR
jgi:serine/threonine protein kinase